MTQHPNPDIAAQQRKIELLEKAKLHDLVREKRRQLVWRCWLFYG